MKKLSKEQIAQIDSASSECARIQGEINDLVVKYNEFLEEWKGIAEEQVKAYNQRVNEILAVYRDAAEEGREYQSEKSERWADSEAGSDYEEWLSKLEDVEIDLYALDLGIPDPLDEVDEPDWEDTESFLPPNAPGE
jgi:hypothetical protein